MHRCAQRRGIFRRPDVEDGKGIKRRFKTCPSGYFHIDIAEVRAAESRLDLLVAMDRTGKSSACTGPSKRQPLNASTM